MPTTLAAKICTVSLASALATDRIGRRHAGRDEQRLEEVEARDDRVHQTGRDEPAEEHSRAEEDRERPPVPQHVGPRQLDADGEDGQRNDDARDFEKNVIESGSPTPLARRKDLRPELAERDADRRCIDQRALS